MSRTTKRHIIPDIEAFEERAAIAEYDGGLSRQEAEDLAARAQEASPLPKTTGQRLPITSSTSVSARAQST